MSIYHCDENPCCPKCECYLDLSLIDVALEDNECVDTCEKCGCNILVEIKEEHIPDIDFYSNSRVVSVKEYNLRKFINEKGEDWGLDSDSLDYLIYLGNRDEGPYCENNPEIEKEKQESKVEVVMEVSEKDPEEELLDVL